MRSLVTYCPGCRRVVFAERADQMTFDELDRRVDHLRNAGFDPAIVFDDVVRTRFGCKCDKDEKGEPPQKTPEN